MSSAGQDAERLANDPNSAAALRAEAQIRKANGNYAGAVEVTATDWNSLAWASLFLPEPAAPALEAANTANRLTQNRNSAPRQTLGCVKAATGDTSGARKALFQYLDSAGAMNDGGHLLLGMIQEQLSLTDAARVSYLKSKSRSWTTLSRPMRLHKNICRGWRASNKLVRSE
jgi:hypothetical protein